MSMIQLIYASRPFDFDEGTLISILTASRGLNARDGITGALICRGDLYLQLLEGPEELVDAAYRRILQDRRHLDLKLLCRRPVTERLFPGWAMRNDPARSWMWTQEEVNSGAIERATEAELAAIFERLAREEPRRHAVTAAAVMGCDPMRSSRTTPRPDRLLRVHAASR